MHSVLDPGFLLFQLGFGSGTDLDDGDSAGELGQPLLKLLTVVIGGGLFDLGSDLFDPGLDVGILAEAFDDGGVVLIDMNLFSLSQPINADVLKLDADVLGDQTTAGEDGDILEHGLPSLTKTGSLYGGNAQSATQFVDDQGGQGFALHILGDDEQGLAGLGNLLQEGKHVPQGGDLLFVEEDEGILDNALHPVGVGDEVGGDVTAVKLHPFDELESGLQGFGLFHGDDAVFADFVHGVGDDLADLHVVVGGDGTDLGDHGALDVPLHRLKALDDLLDGSIDTLLDEGCVGPGADILEALAVDLLGQNGGGGGPVSGYVGGLGGDFPDHLGADVLQGVLQLYLFRNGDPVLRDGGGTELLLDDHVTTLGAEGGFNGGGKNFHALQNLLSGIIAKNNFLSHGLPPITLRF